MTGFSIDLEKATKDNNYFRKVLYTAPHSQLVLMCLKPREDIGMEVHDKEDQFFRVDEGEGKAILNDTEYILKDGYCVVIPAGTMHNILNTSEDKELKMYTIYSPAHHPDKTLHETKEIAMQHEHEE